jgi:hypothetical protein
MSARPRGNPRVEPEEHRRELWDPIESYVDPRGAARQNFSDSRAVLVLVWMGRALEWSYIINNQ